MDDYTPTTEEIRGYVEVGGQPRPWDEPDDAAEGRRAAAFDRWLAARDRERDAKAWHEGFCVGERSGALDVPMNPYAINPYKQDGGI